MGFFDDLKMGVGAAPKTDDYKQRTAATIERNQGRAAAEKYRSDVGATPAGNQALAEIAMGRTDNYSPAPTTLASYGPKPDFFRDANLDRRIGYRDLFSFAKVMTA